MARVLLFCLAIIGAVNARPEGVPSAACGDMTPRHGGNTYEGPNWDIASACYVIFPSDSMRIRIWDRNGAGQFKGLFFQVRDDNDATAGTWSIPETTSGFKTMQCGGNNHGAVSHTSRVLKSDTETEVTWTAPAQCEDNEHFRIKATIVPEYGKYNQIELLMICNPDYSDKALMETVRPPLSSQYCAQGSWAIIPTRASDSFETGLGQGSWRHFYGGVGFRFERFQSPAPGAANPNNYPQASDGSYYMYYKASGTSKNDMAGLLSPFGIQGCFCFKLDCWMDTDGVTRFVLRTIGDSMRELLSTTEVTSFWRSVSFSILSDKPVIFAFEVFNSGVQSGGVGLDNIVVSPGPCDDKAAGYSGFVDFTA